MSSLSALNSLLSSASGSSLNLSSLLQAATGATSPGIDVTSAVDAAIYAAQAPERQWQAQQSTIASQISSLTSIQSALSSVSNDLNSLNDLGGPLASRTVTSSSAGQVTASAAAGTSIGTHLVAVQGLASSASWYSGSMSSATSPLGTSTLTVTSSSGSQQTYTTGSGVNSLSDLASAINASASGVVASVINDASGSRLALVSSTTGAAADFAVSYGGGGGSWSSATVASPSSALSAESFQLSDGTTTASVTVNAGDTLSTVANSINALGIGVTASIATNSAGAYLQLTAGTGSSVSISTDPVFDVTRASTASNASLTVDGIPITSQSNVISGTLAGLTLNLSGTTASNGPVTLSVSADHTAITQAVSAFVSDYNAALSLVNTQFKYSATSGAQGVLGADSAVRSLQGALLSIGGYSAGTTSGSGGSSSPSIQSLSDLGISMQDDGTLSLDNSTLAAALANPAAVQNFFQGSSLNGFAQQINQQISVFNNPSSGSITNEIQNLNQQYSSLQSQVNDYESGYIASQRTTLTAMYSKAEIALQELPAQMKEIQSQLGNNSSGG